MLNQPQMQESTQRSVYSWPFRQDFPVLRDRSLTYLDSAASAQKPDAVICALQQFYSSEYANIHRGVYELSIKATARYEAARARAASFLGARPEEVIFTRGATEGINLVASSWGRKFLRPGDRILITLLEHHSNFVPWQLIAEQTGAILEFSASHPDGTVDMEDFRRQLERQPKMVAVTQLANGLGAAPPLEEMIPLAHRAGAVVLVDGAQAISHVGVDVKALGADFYAFSGHKLYGPTGTGVLYGRRELLDAMPPYMGGGDMIRSVSRHGTEYNDVPFKFEAGTPNIAGAVGLAAAVDYVEGIGIARIAAHEALLIAELERRIADMPRVHALGPDKHVALVCFTFDGVHPHDLAQFLSDRFGIAVRAGHHCAQPLLEHLCIAASTRASLGLYNTMEDIERLCEGLEAAAAFF